MTRSQSHRQSSLLRICAAMLLLVWVAASGHCMDRKVPASSAGHFTDKAADLQLVASHSHSDAGHSHDSDKHDGDEHSCCDSLQVSTQVAGFVSFAKPDFGKFLSSAISCPVPSSALEQPAAVSLRMARICDRVFTPLMCLGPAFRSHAPPTLFV